MAGYWPSFLHENKDSNITVLKILKRLLKYWPRCSDIIPESTKLCRIINHKAKLLSTKIEIIIHQNINGRNSTHCRHAESHNTELQNG